MDSFFSSPVDVMLPPCCLYLTQYEAESPAWILSPLSRYMDSFFYVVKTLPSLLLYVLYFYSCVIPSHPPFPKDLTADGDIESNPGPLSKDSLEYLNPGQWILNPIVDKFREKMPSFTIRYSNVPKSQTPSDCGIYVIAYVQK
ncbi:hypothetical protein GEMRC1_009171 [Eukaryota sp. GEM-RC1]